MKNDQNIRKLDDVVEDMHQGLNTAGYKIQFFEAGYPIIQSRNIENGVIDLDEKIKFMSESDWNLYKDKFKPSIGDVFFSNIGTIGKTAVVTEDLDYLFHWNIFIFKLKKGILHSFYLKYFLDYTTNAGYFRGLQRGGTVTFITKKMITDVPIIVPPLPEQQRIVAILDEVFEAIARAKENAARNLKNARELFEAVLQGVFANPGEGWEEKKLQDIALSFGRGKSKHRPRNDPKLYGGNYPFIQTGDIRNSHHYITEYSQTYNDVGLAQSKLWPKGTICITIAANIAETGILGFDACFPDSVIGLVANPELADSDFVEYLLQFFKARLQAKGKGSAQDNINVGTFESEVFPFPSLSEQKCIVVKLKTLSEESKKLEAIYRQKLYALEELKKSILQKAFEGEL